MVATNLLTTCASSCLKQTAFPQGFGTHQLRGRSIVNHMPVAQAAIGCWAPGVAMPNRAPGFPRGSASQAEGRAGPLPIGPLGSSLSLPDAELRIELRIEPLPLPGRSCWRLGALWEAPRPLRPGLPTGALLTPRRADSRSAASDPVGVSWLMLAPRCMGNDGILGTETCTDFFCGFCFASFTLRGSLSKWKMWP